MTHSRLLPALFSLIMTGCRGGATSEIKLIPTPPPANADPVIRKPAFNAERIRPNELGLIPIVMYHDVGGPAVARGPRFDRRGLNIRPETFRRQLELMRKAGWYPINVRDALAPSLDVPAGKIPVAITFDDGRGSQFRYLPDGRLDPDCAVAILEQFHERHPQDWPLRATFYVMPPSHWNPPPFYQSKSCVQKLKYLLEEGFEVANHSTSHRLMAKMDLRTLQWELAECLRGIRRLAPEATMDTFALPYGAEPADRRSWDVLLNGRDGETAYANRCVLIAWGGPTYPRAHKRFDRRSLTRIGVEPGYLERWIQRLKPGKAVQPYVSDGDPYFFSIPRTQVKWVNHKALSGSQLYVWNDLEPKPVQKVANAARASKPASP